GLLAVRALVPPRQLHAAFREHHERHRVLQLLEHLPDGGTIFLAYQHASHPSSYACPASPIPSLPRRRPSGMYVFVQQSRAATPFAVLTQRTSPPSASEVSRRQPASALAAARCALGAGRSLRRFNLLLHAVGENAQGALAAVGHGAAAPELRQEAGYLLAGRADAARHLLVGRVLVADDAAVGLRHAFPG